MPEPEIAIGEAADEATVGELREAISAFNFSATDIRDGREFFAAVRDGAGALLGGIYGWTWGGTGWVEYLWVREDARHQRLGSRLLEAAERVARERGCGQLALSTHSFQAPDFYRRHGFQVVGRLAGYPAGHAYYLLGRPLNPV
jgi:GNAT superfamily N-acetyltransferase